MIQSKNESNAAVFCYCSFQIHGMNEEGGERLEFLDAPHFIIQQRHEYDVKVVAVQIKALSNVLILHAFARQQFAANFLGFPGQCVFVLYVPLAEFFGVLFRKEHLIDDNVVTVNAVFGELLHQTFRLVNGKEFGNTDADKGGARRVLKGHIDLLNNGARLFQLTQELVLGRRRIGATTTHERRRLSEETTKAVFELPDLDKGLFENGGKGEQANGVSGGGGVKDDDVKVEGVDLFHEFGKGKGLVNAGNGVLQVIEHGGEGITLAGVHVGVDNVGTADILLRGINFHGRQICKAIDGGRLATDLLTKGVGEIVCRIRADQEDLLLYVKER